MAKIKAEDVFIAFYNSFHRLERLNPEETPEALEQAQLEVKNDLEECSMLLEKYVDMRVRRNIRKMIDAGELMVRKSE